MPAQPPVAAPGIRAAFTWCRGPARSPRLLLGGSLAWFLATWPLSHVPQVLRALCLLPRPPFVWPLPGLPPASTPTCPSSRLDVQASRVPGGPGASCHTARVLSPPKHRPAGCGFGPSPSAWTSLAEAWSLLGAGCPHPGPGSSAGTGSGVMSGQGLSSLGGWELPRT